MSATIAANTLVYYPCATLRRPVIDCSVPRCVPRSAQYRPHPHPHYPPNGTRTRTRARTRTRTRTVTRTRTQDCGRECRVGRRPESLLDTFSLVPEPLLATEFSIPFSPKPVARGVYPPSMVPCSRHRSPTQTSWQCGRCAVNRVNEVVDVVLHTRLTGSEVLAHPLLANALGPSDRDCAQVEDDLPALPIPCCSGGPCANIAWSDGAPALRTLTARTILFSLSSVPKLSTQSPALCLLRVIAGPALSSPTSLGRR